MSETPDRRPPGLPTGSGGDPRAVPRRAEPRQAWRSRRIRRIWRAQWATLGAISAGGVVGALTRYGISTALPHPPGGFAWATFLVNVTGCLLIGVLMVLVTEVWQARPLVRPFLGIGVLGGFTTFSAYILDVGQTVAAGSPETALAYLASTAVAALVAVHLGASAIRLLIRPRIRPRGEELS